MFVKKNAHSGMKLTVCIVISTLLFFWTAYSNGGVWLFELNNPYWYIRLDASGYADISYWYPSIRHSCENHHEMLTGEWAAGIYYDGIATGSEAMWLTDKFMCPNSRRCLFAGRDYGIIERAIRREVGLRVNSWKNSKKGRLLLCIG
jgi:hypothetical protein